MMNVHATKILIAEGSDKTSAKNLHESVTGDSKKFGEYKDECFFTPKIFHEILKSYLYNSYARLVDIDMSKLSDQSYIKNKLNFAF